MRPRHVAMMVGAAAISILLVREGLSYYQFNEVTHHFDSVQRGSLRTAVEQELGKPNYHLGKCGKIVDAPKECTTEYVYASPLAPWVPEYYIVWFSPNDEVIGTFYTTSP